MLNDDADIGIVFDDTITTGTKLGDEFETKKLCTQVSSLIVAKTHPLAESATPVSLEQLRDLDLALLPSAFSLRGHVDRHFIQHGLKPRVAFESNSIALIMDAVRFGELVTFFGKDVIRVERELVALELNPALPDRSVVLMRRRAAYQSAASRAFIDLLVRWCADLNAGCETDHTSRTPET